MNDRIEQTRERLRERVHLAIIEHKHAHSDAFSALYDHEDECAVLNAALDALVQFHEAKAELAVHGSEAACAGCPDKSCGYCDQLERICTEVLDDNE